MTDIEVKEMCSYYYKIRRYRKRLNKLLPTLVDRRDIHTTEREILNCEDIEQNIWMIFQKYELPL